MPVKKLPWVPAGFKPDLAKSSAFVRYLCECKYDPKLDHLHLMFTGPAEISNPENTSLHFMFTSSPMNFGPFTFRLDVPGSKVLQHYYPSVCLAFSKVISSLFLCPLSLPLPMLALMRLISLLFLNSPKGFSQILPSMLQSCTS